MSAKLRLTAIKRGSAAPKTRLFDRINRINSMTWPQKNTAAVAEAMAGQEDHKRSKKYDFFYAFLAFFRGKTPFSCPGPVNFAQSPGLIFIFPRRD
jgi:ketosteroid isomerase-like protein